jgi:AbrB family looped-hinge helix DNA binding protein
MNIVATPIPAASEIVVTLTRKGQVTIPAAVRRMLGIPTQGKVALEIDPHAKAVRLHAPRYPSMTSLAGAAGKLDH